MESSEPLGDFEALISGVSLLEEAEGLGRSLGSSKWNATLEILESAPHVEQLLMLTELASILSYANEESMIGFPSWNYMRVLMHTIRSPGVKYCKVKGKSVEEALNPERSPHQGAQMPFYELLSAIYKNHMQVGVPDVVVVPTESAASAHADRKPEQASSQPQETAEVEDEFISEDIAANKAITAAGCLNTILDILPHSSSFFMSNPKQFDTLKSKLHDIQYIDLAERILLIYDKLVKEIPVSVVKSKSLVAMLEFVDFFPSEVQISTFTSVMNAVKKIERADSCYNYLIPLIPYLGQALGGGNKKIIQIACVTWKLIISKGVRAATRKESCASAIVPSMVKAVSECNALRDMCRLVFSENDKLRRINVNQCLYCMAVVTNESNDLVARLFEYDVLPHVGRWLSYSGEDTLLRLVDLGLAIMGSYFSESSSNDSPQLSQRLSYFRQNPDLLLKVAVTFPMGTLMEIFDGTISQHLRRRIMLLQLRLLGMAIKMEQCREQILEGLPFNQLVNAVCYSLRYQHEDNHCEVAVRLIVCLLHLMDHGSIIETLRRHGVSSLLSSVRNSKLGNDIAFIMQRIPQPDVQMIQKSGRELIAELKAQGNSMTLYELTNSGMLSLDYDDLLSRQSLNHLLQSILFRDSEHVELVEQTVDGEGLATLWSAFIRILETQPEFMFNLKEDDVSDDDGKNEDGKQEECSVDMATSEAQDDVSEKMAEASDSMYPAPVLEIMVQDTVDETKQSDEASMPDTCSVSNDNKDMVGTEEVVADSSAVNKLSKTAVKVDEMDHDKNGDGGEKHHPRSPSRSSFKSSASGGSSESRPKSHKKDSGKSSGGTPEPSHDSIASMDGFLRSDDVLNSLCEDIAASASKSGREGGDVSNTTEDRRTRYKRSDERSRKLLQQSFRMRHRLKGALGLINQFAKTESLPFPFSHICRDIKLKLKCRDTDDDLGSLPTLSIYTSPMVSVAKVESYVLVYLNSRARKGDESQSCAPKKRAKTAPNSQAESENAYTGVQLYYKGVALAPTMQIYKALFALRGHGDATIWEEHALLNFSVIHRSNEFELQRLHWGRYTTLMASICDDRHSAVGLYMDFASHVNDYDDSSLEATLTRVRERLSALDYSGSPSKIQCVMDKVRHGNMESCGPYSGVGNSRSAKENGNSTSSNVEPHMMETGDSPVKVTDPMENRFHVDYLSKRIMESLDKMDKILMGKPDNDVLVTANMYCSSSSGLGDDSRKHLRMLVVLHVLINELNVYMGGQMMDIKYSKRLTLKLLTLLGKLDESLCYRTPAWFIRLVMTCPSLFSLESRRILFDVVAVGPHRLLTQFHARMCGLADSDGGSGKEIEGNTVGAFDEILRQNILSRKAIKSTALQEVESVLHIPKLKSICSRQELVRDAMLVMDQLVRNAGELDAVPRLEIEFEDEVGVGSGPTQEFYSLVLERLLEGNGEYGVILEDIGGYLYPKVRPCSAALVDDINIAVFRRPPRPASEGASISQETVTTKIFRAFKLLGQVAAASLMDGKLLNLRMHPLFWQMCQQPTAEHNCSLAALSAVDPNLALYLGNLRHEEDLEAAELYFSYDGVPVAPGGLDLKVTKDNVDEYIDAVVKLRVYDGVKLQVWAFRMGFATLLPLESLSLFTPLELANQVFSTRDQSEFWTLEHLHAYILPDHGYDISSIAYKEFIATLASFTEEERRQFLRFCTGAPVLPKEGFAGLRPVMKVVKKGENTDELPSVMTCSNYLKLPNYTSGQQLRLKLLQAIREGQGSFNLS